MRGKIFFALVTTLLLLFFVGCSILPQKQVEQGSVTNPEAKISKIRMLYSEWPPDMLAYLAQEKGFFKKNGVEVELVWVSGFEEAQEKRRNNLTDIWNYTLLDFIAEYTEGVDDDMQIVLLEDYSAGADAIMTIPKYNLKTISDLDGENVGVEKGTIGEFFLDLALKKAEMSLADLNIINVASDDVPTLLQEGKIKAGVCYEPCISTILNYGGVVITDSKELRGAIVDVYVAKKSHLDNNREAYIRVIKSIVEAGEYYNENTLESADIMKDKLGMNRQEVVDTFDKLEIPDLRDNETAFSRNSGYSSLYGLSRKAHNFLSETNGNNAKNIDFDLLINGSLVDEIVKNQQE